MPNPPRCPWTSADECATAAERTVAGTPMRPPLCATHQTGDMHDKGGSLVRDADWYYRDVLAPVLRARKKEGLTPS